jgi:hypothetical protein
MSTRTARRKRKTPHADKILKENLARFQQDCSHLAGRTALAAEPKFLLRMAIMIKQLYFDAAKVQKEEELKVVARRIHSFLSKPWELPLGKRSFLEAADTYSHQHPRYSDLSQLLDAVSKDPGSFIA